MSQCNASPQGPEKKILPFLSTKEIADEEFLKTFHTACLDTIFIQIYMDAPPGPGPRGVKNQIFFLQIKLFSSCAKIAPKRHKLQKSSKLKKMSKKPCFTVSETPQKKRILSVACL